MDFLTFEQVSHTFLNCYPNNSLSSSTNFLPEQIHLKGEWEVAFSEISYLHCTKTFQRERLLS